MSIRSSATASAMLVMSIVAGFAQDWPQSPFDQTKSSQGRAQSPQNGTQNLQDWTQNLYAHIDAGIMFQQDTTLYQSTSTPKAKDATFNPGIRGNLALGYNINKSLAVELDTGVLWNSIDKVGGVSLGSIPYPFNASFDTYTVPLLADIIYKIPLKGSWSPYVGIGVGGAATIASYSVGGNNVGDYNFVLAYQAEAGLKYNLTKNASLGIAYEFFGMANPRWYFNSSLVSNHTKEDGFYTHSITFSFNWNF